MRTRRFRCGRPTSAVALPSCSVRRVAEFALSSAGRATPSCPFRSRGTSARSTSASLRRSCSTKRSANAVAPPTVAQMSEPTLYLFDGHNLLHAGELSAHGELIDALASFVAVRGVRGVVVFDGSGEEREIGQLSVRYAPHADDVLERLAAEHRRDELVCLVSSDAAIRGVSGQEVRTLSSRLFV